MPKRRIRRLLVGHDLTDAADRALGRALQVAELLDLPVTVMHVLPAGLPEPIAGRRQAEARDLLQDRVAAFATIGDAARVTAQVHQGRVAETMIAEADRQDSGLTILGTREAGEPSGGLGRSGLGATTERLLRRGDAPVLLVRTPPAGGYHRVMIAADFSVYSRRALQCATVLVPGGAFEVVHAYDVPFVSQSCAARDRNLQRLEAEMREEMAALLDHATADPGATLRPEFRLGAPLPTILAAARERTPDLLVVGTHGRTGVAHALLGSVAETLMAEAPCDVLAVRAW